MPAHYSTLDLAACLWSFALFSLFALAPGYAAGWLADLLEFRKRTLVARIAISIPLSISLAPIMAYLAGRFVSATAVWVVFGAIWLVVLAIALRQLVRKVPRLALGRLPAAFPAILAGWLAAGLVMLIDWQIKDRLYYSVVSFDYELRTALVSSISRTGIPPANPLFFPGHLVPLSYHYFWLIPCSLVNQLGGSLVSARQAMIGGTLWCGLGLIAIIPLYLRFFHPAGAHRIARRSLIGIGLLAVTGLDVIPNLLRDLNGIPLPDPEWWNNFQVSSWVTSVLWVPHHTVAMISGLMAILILWNSNRANSAVQRAGWMLIAGLAMATCLGSSIYVGLIFGVALMIWTAILLFHRSNREAAFAVAVGCIALAAVARQILDLRGVAASGVSGGSILMFRVSDFVFTGLFRDWIGHSQIRLNLVNALLLPANYFLELGAFLMGGIWTLRRWSRSAGKMNRYQMATLTFAATSILICTFFRSSTIANNDLGPRGFLLGQFVLLLWMTDVVQQKRWISPGRRALLGALLLIGVVSSVHEIVVLRTYPIVSDLLQIPRSAWLSRDHNLGRRTYALREGYEKLQAALPESAIVQHNPNAVPGDLPWGLYGDRQAVADTPGCGVVFGGDPDSCADIQAQLKPIFNGESRWEDVVRACRNLAITAILVKDTDPAWADRQGWVWRQEPIVANPFMRAIPCYGGALPKFSYNGDSPGGRVFQRR